MVIYIIYTHMEIYVYVYVYIYVYSILLFLQRETIFGSKKNRKRES